MECCQFSPNHILTALSVLSVLGTAKTFCLFTNFPVAWEFKFELGQRPSCLLPTSFICASPAVWMRTSS